MTSTLTQKKRAAIIEAAGRLFLDKGYGSVSMDEIAATAKVSKRTVYNHFPSKELLFSEIVSGTWSDSNPPELKYHKNTEIRNDLAAFAEKCLIMLRSEKFTKLIRLVMGESGRFPELTRIYSEQGIRSLISTLTAYLKEADNNIEDHQLAAQYFLGMIKEALFWPVLLGIIPMPSPDRDKKVIEEAADIFTRIYGL